MKKRTFPILLLAVITILAFTSCDAINSFIASRTRPLKLIEIYNSNLKQTNKMVPNDTLYVKVQGLVADTTYTVQCKDPEDETITEIITQTDESGVIGLSPLWFDVGFTKDDSGRPYLDTSVELALRAFNIRVFSTDDNGASTDFKLPFFFVNSTDFQRPQPIVLAGKLESGTFNVENAFYSNNAANTGADADHPGPDKLYVKVENMDDLAGEDTARVYIVPFNAETYRDGDIIQDAWFSQDCTLAELTSATGVLIEWPTTSSPYYVPTYAEGNAFSVILDVGNDGVYDVLKEGTTTYHLDGIDGNGVAGFIVKKPPVTTADYVPLNLASGGIYGWGYDSSYNWRFVSGYDYRDEFLASGAGTKYSTSTGEFWGYGVKVIWNPYQTPAGWGSETMPSGFWGSTVDVYIVSNSQTLNTGDAIVPATGTTKRRVPVQYGCSNGCWQQTIWRAPMTVGNYLIVVDMDKDGEISDNDLVDNLSEGGTVRALGGFSVK